MRRRGLQGRAIPRQRGFSLIELAVVFAILGVLIGAVIRPIVADNENRVLNETRTVVDDARDALLSYVAATGYFPCPADGASNGQEAAGFNRATGACTVWHGFLPAAALGLTPLDAQGYAVDGNRQQQNRVRYAVSNQTVVGITNPFTRIGGIRRVGLASIDSENLLMVCTTAAGVNAGVDCGGAGTLASRAVAVVWSVGGNALTGGASADEAENPNPNGGSADRIFVSRPRVVVPGAEFDDVLAWIPVNLVVNRMIAQGVLP